MDVFETTDGRVFRSEAEALKHERLTATAKFFNEVEVLWNKTGRGFSSLDGRIVAAGLAEQPQAYLAALEKLWLKFR